MTDQSTSERIAGLRAVIEKAEARIDELCEREYQIREKTHDLYDVIDSAQAEIDRLESGR